MGFVEVMLLVPPSFFLLEILFILKELWASRKRSTRNLWLKVNVTMKVGNKHCESDLIYLLFAQQSQLWVNSRYFTFIFLCCTSIWIHLFTTKHFLVIDGYKSSFTWPPQDIWSSK
jgi:hypothetical protein